MSTTVHLPFTVPPPPTELPRDEPRDGVDAEHHRDIYQAADRASAALAQQHQIQQEQYAAVYYQQAHQQHQIDAMLAQADTLRAEGNREVLYGFAGTAIGGAFGLVLFGPIGAAVGLGVGYFGQSHIPRHPIRPLRYGRH